MDGSSVKIDFESVIGSCKALADEFACIICCNLLKDPVSCSICLASFCYDCVSRWVISSNGKCPNRCLYQSVKLNPTLERLLNSIIISCPDCEEQINYGSYNKFHYKTCPMVLEECAYCHKDYRKKDKLEHLDSCPLFSIKCVFCHFDIPRNIFDNHQAECMEADIYCTQCGISIKKKDCFTHFSACSASKNVCSICNELANFQSYKEHNLYECTVKQIIKQNFAHQLEVEKLQGIIKILTETVENQRQELNQANTKKEYQSDRFKDKLKVNNRLDKSESSSIFSYGGILITTIFPFLSSIFIGTESGNILLSHLNDMSNPTNIMKLENPVSLINFIHEIDAFISAFSSKLAVFKVNDLQANLLYSIDCSSTVGIISFAFYSTSIICYSSYSKRYAKSTTDGISKTLEDESNAKASCVCVTKSGDVLVGLHSASYPMIDVYLKGMSYKSRLTFSAADSAIAKITDIVENEIDKVFYMSYQKQIIMFGANYDFIKVIKVIASLNIASLVFIKELNYIVCLVKNTAKLYSNEVVFHSNINLKNLATVIKVVPGDGKLCLVSYNGAEVEIAPI